MKKQSLMFAMALVTSLSAALAHADNNCWKKEVNPATHSRYASEDEWNNNVIDWSKSMPRVPSIWDLFIGREVGNRASKKATEYPNRLKTDKQMHCYVGCRIAKQTNVRTATYAAWFKEVSDITDCKLGSHFDPADFEATVFGAEIGDRDGKCVAECSEMVDTQADQ